MNTTPCTKKLIWGTFFTLPMFILQVLSFLWIRKLHNMHDQCKCAVMDRRHIYIMYYLGVTILLTIFFWGYRIYTGCSKLRGMAVMIALIYLFVMIIATIVFIVYGFKYVKYLKESKCECALKGNGDEMFKVLVILRTIGIAIALLLLIPVFFIFLYLKAFVDENKATLKKK